MSILSEIVKPSVGTGVISPHVISSCKIRFENENFLQNSCCTQILVCEDSTHFLIILNMCWES